MPVRPPAGRVADLQGKAEGRAVAYGLAVTADGANLLGSQRRLGEQGLGAAANSRATRLSATPCGRFRSPRGAEVVQGGPYRWPGMAQRRLDPKRIPSIVTSTASIPSMLVPDIKPI